MRSRFVAFRVVFLHHAERQAPSALICSLCRLRQELQETWKRQRGFDCNAKARKYESCFHRCSTQMHGTKHAGCVAADGMAAVSEQDEDILQKPGV